MEFRKCKILGMGDAEYRFHCWGFGFVHPDADKSKAAACTIALVEASDGGIVKVVPEKLVFTEDPIGIPYDGFKF